MNVAPATTHEADPIEYEMDVFLAPDLAPHLNLLQYPTHYRAMAPPLRARVKPRHGMLATDHATLDNAIRTYTSQTIPITTHLCIGKIVPGGTSIRLVDSIHLVPIARIQQMRPSFKHLETAGADPDGDHNKNNATSQEDMNRPVTFQRKESERAAAARKSSYQFKKRSEDGEDWCELQIVLGDTQHDTAMPDASHDGLPEVVSSSVINRDSYLQRTYCLDLENNLFAPATNRSYVQSLNYIGNSDPSGDYDKAMSLEEAQANPKLALLHKVRHMLQSGVPIPYSAIRRRVDSEEGHGGEHTIDDPTMFDTLKDCAVLCRGNWCLLSKFCIDLPDRLKRLRTFVLLILEEEGIVHRHRLLSTFEQLGDSYTPEQVKIVLTNVAKHVSGGWIPKIDDDNHFIIGHREVCKTHRAYWQQQQDRFRDELSTYHQSMG